jgi:hypothetical protein
MRAVAYYRLNMILLVLAVRFPANKNSLKIQFKFLLCLQSHYFMLIRKYHKEINAPKSTQEMREK